MIKKGTQLAVVRHGRIKTMTVCTSCRIDGAYVRISVRLKLGSQFHKNGQIKGKVTLAPQIEPVPKGNEALSDGCLSFH